MGDRIYLFLTLETRQTFRGVVGGRKERWGHLESEITSHLGLKKKIHECLYKGETLDFVKMIVVKMYYSETENPQTLSGKSSLAISVHARGRNGQQGWGSN